MTFRRDTESMHMWQVLSYLVSIALCAIFLARPWIHSSQSIDSSDF
jgi:hypothetical protein